MKFLTVVFFLFLFCGTSFAKTTFELVEIAIEEGTKVGYKREILGIFEQESILGTHPTVISKQCSDNGKSCGNMQVSISTARFVAETLLHMKKMTDQEIKRKLIHDDRFNIMIGATYYKYLVDVFNDRDLATLAYNVGMGNVTKYGLKKDPNKYLKKVKWHMIKRIGSIMSSEKIDIAKKYKYNLYFSKTHGFWVLSNNESMKIVPKLEVMSNTDFEKYIIKEKS